MDRSRWLAFGAILVFTFIASVAVGSWVRGHTAAPALSNGPTPTQSAPAATTASPNPVTATIPPTAPPSPTPEPTAALDPATAEEFAAAILAAFQTGDTQYLADRLHPAVIERYGEQQCRTHIAGFTADPSASWTFVSSRGPAPWSWETDSVATTIQEAWTITVNEPAGPHDLHFAPSDGQWRWFLDCGDPK